MKKRILALIMAAMIIILSFAGCSSSNNEESTTAAVTTTEKQTDDTSFKLSYTQSDSLDPFEAQTQNNQVLATLVFESLFDLDENYEAVANIASDYAFTDSTTLKVDINPQLKFSDGSTIDAEDVAYSADAALDSPAYGSALTCFDYVSADGSSVIFHLKYPDPYAVNLLTFPIASKDNDGSLPIGSGRYSYAKSDGETVLKANKTNGFDPYITTIHLVNIAAADSIDNAVNIGNISYAFRDMSSDTSKRLSCAKKAVVMNNLVYIGVNSASGITSNAKIRQAISMAADRTVISQSAYAGYASPAESVFNPAFKSIGNVTLFGTAADSQNAAQLVKESGIKDLSISILVDNNENKISCANLLKNQLEAIGFKVTINKKSASQYKSLIRKSNFQLYIGEVKLADDMCLYPFLSSSGGARYGIDLKKMKCDDIYSDYLAGDSDLGSFILAFNEEMPYIPLVYKKGMICYSKSMSGDMQGYYGNFFSNIESWYFNS